MFKERARIDSVFFKKLVHRFAPVFLALSNVLHCCLPETEFDLRKLKNVVVGELDSFQAELRCFVVLRKSDKPGDTFKDLQVHC